MSIIKSIKQVLGLGPAAENHHWDGSVPNELSLKRGTPEAPGTELIKALNGILSFPNQGQLLADNGYVMLPGGLIVQWGTNVTSVGGGVVVTYPIAFPITTLSFSVTPYAAGALEATTKVVAYNNSTLSVNLFNGGVVGAAQFSWLAIGY